MYLRTHMSFQMRTPVLLSTTLVRSILPPHTRSTSLPPCLEGMLLSDIAGPGGESPHGGPKMEEARAGSPAEPAEPQ